MIKEKYIHSRVTEEEYEKIILKSKKVNKSLSKFIRDRALGKSDTIIEGLPDITLELKRIGNNINQLSKNINIKNKNNIEVDDYDRLQITKVEMELKKIWQQLNLLTQKRI